MTPTLENLSEAVAAELRAALAYSGTSYGQLASVLGVPVMWVSRRCRGVVDLSVNDLAAMCEAADLDLVTVLTSAIGASK